MEDNMYNLLNRVSELLSELLKSRLPPKHDLLVLEAQEHLLEALNSREDWQLAIDFDTR